MEYFLFSLSLDASKFGIRATAMAAALFFSLLNIEYVLCARTCCLTLSRPHSPLRPLSLSLSYSRSRSSTRRISFQLFSLKLLSSVFYVSVSLCVPVCVCVCGCVNFLVDVVVAAAIL